MLIAFDATALLSFEARAAENQSLRAILNELAQRMARTSPSH